MFGIAFNGDAKERAKEGRTGKHEHHDQIVLTYGRSPRLHRHRWRVNLSPRARRAEAALDAVIDPARLLVQNPKPAGLSGRPLRWRSPLRPTPASTRWGSKTGACRIRNDVFAQSPVNTEDHMQVMTFIRQRWSIFAPFALLAIVLVLAVELSAPAAPAHADHNPGTFFLQTVDINTGEVTDIGGNNLIKTSAIAFDDSTLYAVDGAGQNCTSASNLYTLDPTTAAVVETVGSTGYFHVTGLAVNPQSGVLYATANGDTTQCFSTFANAQLLTLDPNTGAATLIGATGLQIPDIAFSPSGTLFAWNENDDDMYTLNLTDGTSTLVGESNTNSFQTGLAVDAGGTIYMKAGGDLYTIDDSTGEGTFVIELSSETNNMLAFNTSGVLYTGTRDTFGPNTGIQVAAAQPNPTSVSPVAFEVTFDEPVTGFDETDIDLSFSSAGTGTVVVTDTGDGAHYTVSVVVTSSGTVTAFVPDDAAVDRAGHGNASSGTSTIIFDDEDPVIDSLTVTLRGPKAIVAFSATDELLGELRV